MSAYRPEPERFWEKVDKTESCWIWTAGCFGRNQEYGCFYLTGGRKAVPAHRWSYEYLVGPIPEGLVLDHIRAVCRTTKCVNPEHLEPVSNQENILRGVGLAAQESRQTHCKWGHSLDDAYILSRNRRHCRTCQNFRNSIRTPEYRKVHG